MAHDRTVTAAHKSEISRDHGKRQTKNELLLTVNLKLSFICRFNSIQFYLLAQGAPVKGL